MAKEHSAPTNSGMAGDGFDGTQYDAKMTELDGHFTPYDKVFDSFDDMGLQENLPRGNYAYG